jgi:uncharacterized protein YegL
MIKKGRILLRNPPLSEEKIETDAIIAGVLDMSGSMKRVRQQTIDGFNEYIEKQRQDEDGGSALVSLTVFDSDWLQNHTPRINTIFEDVDLNDFEPITSNDYKPDGGTPLYDAIGSEISRIESLLTRCKGNPDVYVIIITDGENNTSKEHTQHSIKEITEDLQEQGWNFIYMGANQDAAEVGATMGIHVGNTFSYDASAIQEDVFGCVAASNSAHRTMSKGLKTRGIIESGERYATKAFFEAPSSAAPSDQSSTGDQAKTESTGGQAESK